MADSRSYTIDEIADMCQLGSMIMEWLVLRSMLILNDHEIIVRDERQENDMNKSLQLWPLCGNGTMGLGPILCASAIASSLCSFGEEFVRHCLHALCTATEHICALVNKSYCLQEKLLCHFPVCSKCS